MNKANLIRVVGAEPVSLEEIYHQLRLSPVDSSDTTGRPDDGLLNTYISTAREHCEDFTGKSYVLKEYEIVLSALSGDIELPNPPFAYMVAITIDDNTSENTLDASEYSVDSDTDLYAILSPTGSWPTLATDAVARVRYVAGHGDESAAPSSVPSVVRTAIFLLVGHWYRNREATADQLMFNIPLGVESLLRKQRVLLGMA